MGPYANGRFIKFVNALMPSFKYFIILLNFRKKF